MSELRNIIRQILAEEVQALRQNIDARPKEAVTINNSDDLNAFARMVLSRAQDADFVARFDAGESVFELARQSSVANIINNADADLGVPSVPQYSLQPIPEYRRDIIASNHHVKGAVRQTANPVVIASHGASAPRDIEKTLITERDLEGLAPKSRLRIAKTAVLTPLAKDEIRRQGISIERIPS